MQGSLEMFPLMINNCKIKILAMIVKHLSVLENQVIIFHQSTLCDMTGLETLL